MARIQTPFLTIQAALAFATSGQTVYVYPGTYDEKSLTIPSGVSLRGVSVQTTIIQPSSMAGANQVISMANNTRIEDMTITLSSSLNQTLVGVYILGDPTTVKIRTCVINVNVTLIGIFTPSIYGVYCVGTSASPTTPSSSNTIRATTINVVANVFFATARGILVDSACNFCCRDTNIYVSGSATNSIGVETTNTSSYVQIKTSTVSGVLNDVKQPSLATDGSVPSCLELAATDLVHNNSDNNGFSTKINPTQIYYCVLGGLLSNKTHYLLPGSVEFNNLVNNVVGLLTLQKSILFQGGCQIQHTGGIGSGRFVTVNLYISTTPTSIAAATLFHTFTLTGDGTNFISSFFKNKSITLSASTTYLIVELVTPQNQPSIDALVLTLDFY